MKTVELSDSERELLDRLLTYRWDEADRARMKTRPDSFEERVWLEDQQAIEILQAKLTDRKSVLPTR